MLTQAPTVIALDFDGVLCDGLKEYFQSAWLAYCNLWQLGQKLPPDGINQRFYRLRPVIETGWEMPLVLRAIELGMTDESILQNWITIAQQLVQAENLDPRRLAAEVDRVRDRWIATDLDSWLAEHRFYPGVVERLKTALASSTTVVIISTKETRFIQTLLQQAGVNLTNLRIFGKDVQKPKHQILRELMLSSDQATVFWFVEDRFKTLLGIQQHPDLQQVALFLADWGYNTATERAIAVSIPAIHLISLQQFSAPFEDWVV